MPAERFDDLPALAEIRGALQRETAAFSSSATAAGGAGSATAAVRAPRSGRRRLRALPVLAGIAVPVVVLVVALVLLHGSGSSHRAAGPAGGAPGRQALIRELAPLRRPQTKADLPEFIRRMADDQPGGLDGKVDLPLVRYAGTTPWGTREYIVPRLPPTAQELKTSGVPRGLRRRALERGETVMIESRGGGGGGLTAAEFARRGLDGYMGGGGRTRIADLVPDGVATVTFVFARQPQRGVVGAATYARSQSITVRVHGNVAALQIQRAGGPAGIIWRDAQGQVTKRLGNFSGLNKITKAPRPGPETAASRAAERNPATPNRVWVTPTLGGPGTAFKLHFRQLLNNADYSWSVKGPLCPAIQGSGAGEVGADGLRGRIFTQNISPIESAKWCPGTYRLSVYVADYGLHGRQSGRVRPGTRTTPFGTATFTVR